MIRKMLMVAVLAFTAMLPCTALAGVDLFSVARMVVASGVEDREPVGVADSFPADISKVYCFIEAHDIQKETEVRTVWYHGEEEAASVRLVLGQGPRWRTFSSVNIGNRSGNWRVDLLDEADNIVQSTDFQVE